MNLEHRISSFSRLGLTLRNFLNEVISGQPVDLSAGKDHPGLLKAIGEAEIQNAWLTRKSILQALTYWGEMLDERVLSAWLARYQPAISSGRTPKRVGVVMAGNIPMVGFHDALSVLLSGHHLVARLSSQDALLIPAILDMLIRQDPAWAGRIEFTSGEMDKPQAIIATGSNNTSRYFEYYFGRYPHIIRKNRTGVAILDGHESSGELQGVAADVFTYFGLGCRNVSRLFLPEGYNLKPLHEAFLNHQEIFHHSKYRNNIDYYKSIYLVNRTRFLDGVFYLLVEDEPLSTPVSVLHYSYYTDSSAVASRLKTHSEQIQCVVLRNCFPLRDQFPAAVEPGTAQKPALNEYADGVDTIEFLMEKI